MIDVGRKSYNAVICGGTFKLATYRPGTQVPRALLLGFHGTNRNGATFRNSLQLLADRLGAVAVCPTFPRGRFPREEYQFGGMVLRRRRLRLGERVADVVPELIDWVRRQLRQPRLPVILLGHSAGGQFLSRLCAYAPLPAVRVVIANPSTWVLPTTAVATPFGFGGLQSIALSRRALRNYVSQDVTMLLGNADTGRQQLARSRLARAQGPHRLARGLRMFALLRRAACARRIPCGWSLVRIAGVGHQSAGLFSSADFLIALAPAPAKRAAHCKILFVGDIGFGECYANGRHANHEACLERLGGLLDSADLHVGNLEVPLARCCDPVLRGVKRYLHWSEPSRTVAALGRARFTALSLANNHIMDCGRPGLVDTLARLANAGLVALGAGSDLAEASRPWIAPLSVGSITCSLVVYAGFEYRRRYDHEFDWYAGADKPGVNPVDPAAVRQSVAALRGTLANPLFVAFPHWGTDYQPTTADQRRQAAQLVSAGIDLVVGHGAHVLQSVELIGGRVCAFGLGNFVFNSPGRFDAMRAPPLGAAAALRLFDDAGHLSAALRLYPLLVDNRRSGYQTRPVSAAEFGLACSVLAGGHDRSCRMTFGKDAAGRFAELDLPLPSK